MVVPECVASLEPPLLRVAYGTSRRSQPVGAGCFLLDDPAHLKIAGLWKPARFSVKNPVILPWTLGAFLKWSIQLGDVANLVR